MSLSKSNLNILSSYVNNWDFRSYKSHWSDVLLSHFIGNLNYKGNINKINQTFIANYILALCDSLIDEFLDIN